MASLNIKIDQFCALATSPSWQAWLFRFNKGLHGQLVEHLRSSRSCNANREKMMGIFQQVLGMPGGPEQLIAFLGKNYPHIIDGQSSPSVTKSELANDGVFEHYDPDLLTFPRKLVMSGENLEAKVRDFLALHAHGDFVIIGSRAYVEYLPHEHAQLLTQIPEHNWEVTIFKRQR